MAKLGEGDPRWLVQERSDGTNVNGWHWVERDALEWSKHRLAELFQDLTTAELKVTGLDSCTGEAVVNNRKQKIIPSYELEIKFSWEATVDGQTVKGKIHLPYVADENHDEEPELRFACEKDDAASNTIKQAFLQGPGKQETLKRISQFVSELRAGGPALNPNKPAAATPAAGDAQPKVKLTSADPVPPPPAAAAPTKKSTKDKSAGKSLAWQEQFYCRPQDIFDCLTHEGRLKAFTQSDCSVDLKVGGSFNWFAGSVQGVFTELVPGSRIAMDWKFTAWEESQVCKVLITLEEPEHGHTILHFRADGIPEEDRFGNADVVSNVEQGWKVRVFLRIRQMFGYGLGF